MSFASLLIANRGEIAIRIARTAAELGIRSIGVYSGDDANALHRARVDEAVALEGEGPAAYLDIEQIIRIAGDRGAQAVHPGYGFLAENAAFAAACTHAGLSFIGPCANVLELCGDKAAARALAEQAGLPVLAGLQAPITPDSARDFLREVQDKHGADGAIILKALAGGGGIGMRPVHTPEQIEEAFVRCQSEARTAFGDERLYAERLMPRARHIEVQVAGDRAGMVQHLWERECSLQRQRQKIVEMAPAPGLAPDVRARLLDAAVRLGRELSLDNLATVEFLVDASVAGSSGERAPDFAFIEINARIQVEHTVTEAITGFDLVALQLQLAAGASLQDFGLYSPPETTGAAVQARINLETMQPDGTSRPSGGTLRVYAPPSGPGVRVDGYGYAGYRSNPRFDSLLAKVIAHAPAAPNSSDGSRDEPSDAATMARALGRLSLALAEFGLEGASTNLEFLRALLADPAQLLDDMHTGTVAQQAPRLLAATESLPPPRTLGNAPAAQSGPAAAPALAGARLDATDPLAVLAYGKGRQAELDAPGTTSAPGTLVEADGGSPGPDGTVPIAAPMQGTIVSLEREIASSVRAGQPLLVMEAMKMEHLVSADVDGVLRELRVAVGDTVFEGHVLGYVEPAALDADASADEEPVDLNAIRADLAEVLTRQARKLDANRPDALARRRKTGQRTVRENVDDLIDDGTFIEYGALTLAARRMRMPMDELIDRTPADGLVCGMGLINSEQFDETRARAMVVAYDYTVLAGTQGKKNHQKKDRMFELARKWRLPLVLFAEGGGGRPGDTDVLFGANLQVEAFHRFGMLSGLVPLVGVASGRCFAGNAVLLGCCDVIIATANSTIGMGGPAMIEGGGLGVFTPEQVGPMSVQVPNGVVDVAVADEAEAVAVARQYLSYFQGRVSGWSCPDQRELRRLVPENRLRAYDVRKVIHTLADDDSVLELRGGYGHGIVTAFIRIEGSPIGLIANNPSHLGGAIDSDASDKAARFMQLCDAYDIPILSLCDTPGNMVGPEHERTGLVRHCCRMFVVGANITVPLITVVLRKGYGLGAQGMAGGSFHAPLATLSWPTGEYGGMGLEGAVKLGFRDELAAIEDPDARLAAYEERVAEMYERGKAISIATYFELDDVIDPAETRRCVMAALRSVPPPLPREGKKRTNIDTW